MAGLELHEPVDLQAKTKHDSRALDAASAAGETVSALQQIQKIQSGPKTSETLRQKKTNVLTEADNPLQRGFNV